MLRRCYLLTPFHHNVWKKLDTARSQAMLFTELVVRRLGKELNIRVIGTYDPAKALCAGRSFMILSMCARCALPDCINPRRKVALTVILA